MSRRDRDIRVLAAEADAVWFADELTYAWRSAQDAAVVAYQGWCESPGPSDYAVYRAAQDRADQAQEVLSSRVARDRRRLWIWRTAGSGSRPRPPRGPQSFEHAP
jgi:hypothetical protein